MALGLFGCRRLSGHRWLFSRVPYNVVTLGIAIGQLLFAVTALSLGASVLFQRRPGRGLAIAAMVIAVLGLGVVVLALLALALVR